MGDSNCIVEDPGLTFQQISVSSHGVSPRAPPKKTRVLSRSRIRADPSGTPLESPVRVRCQYSPSPPLVLTQDSHTLGFSGDGNAPFEHGIGGGISSLRQAKLRARHRQPPISDTLISRGSISEDEDGELTENLSLSKLHFSQLPPPSLREKARWRSGKADRPFKLWKPAATFLSNCDLTSGRYHCTLQSEFRNTSQPSVPAVSAEPVQVATLLDVEGAIGTVLDMVFDSDSEADWCHSDGGSESDSSVLSEEILLTKYVMRIYPG
ncbi:hypothetical protein R1sor_025752 [Riccia sorocarpa]|uniref:Uncharacterized protein n=1 Tax=Riccia sorocarpa TaxID=122646 RepID=A0ABD3GDE9_9MARC